MTTDLSNKVMIISLAISTFTGEKVDRNVSEDVAAKHNTTAREAGRFSKQIIGKAALEEIKASASRARAMHYRRTLPWSDTGGRLLATTGYMDYLNELRGIKAEFDKGVENFVGVYPRLIEDAKLRLNGMFNVDDYPDINSLRHRFAFDVSASPLPSTQNWFLDMAEEQMTQLRSHQDERLSHSIDVAIKDTYRRIADVTQKMAEKLSEDKGVFRDSLVENVNDLIGLLPSLNLTGDPELTALTEELSVLTQHGPGMLRSDQELRNTTAAKAQAIFDKASGFM